MRILTEWTQAARGLRRRPGWTAAVFLLLVLGLGANLAIFTVLQAVVLQPPAFPQGERLAMVWETHEENSTRPVAPANFLDWRRQARSFDGLAAVRFDTLSWTGDGPPQVLAAGFASGNLFEVLGVKPLAGRLFDLADESGAGDLVVISEALWRRQFAGDAAALGKTMILGERPYRVLGILPARCEFLRPADVWVAGRRGIPGGAPVDGDPATVRDAHYLRVVGRLRQGVTVQAARAEMTAVAGRLAAAYPDTNHGLGANVTSLQASLSGGARAPLLAMQGGAVLLLLVALANAGTLLVARAVQRGREVAVRQALGASSTALLRAAFAEGVLISTLSALGALAVAWLGTRALVTLAPAGLPRLAEIAVGPASLSMLALLTAGVAVFFAALSLAQRAAPAQVLRGAVPGGGGGRATGRGGGRLRSGLTVLQLGLAYVLLTGATLLAASFARLQAVEPGIRADGLLVGELHVAQSLRAEPARRNLFYSSVLDRLRAIPGVAAADLALTTPLDGAVSRGFWIEGRPRRGANQVDIVGFQTVSAGYFHDLGIALRGRAFAEADAGGASVAIVNRTLAERYFPGQDPIGQRLGVGREGDAAQLRTVVGVCGDVREEGLAAAAPPMLYVPYEQNQEPWNMASLLVRAENGEAPVLSESVRRAVLEIDPDQPLARLGPLQAMLSGQLAPRRFSLQLAGLFALVALLIAALGTYAVVAFETARRRRELGIRMALGAQARALTLGVLGRGLRLAALGLPAGIVAAVLAAHLLRGLLFGVLPGDPLLLGAAAALLLVVASAASLAPALRAARMHPAEALRED